jgi:tripartite-type tricarboxylate transporter receptor subunit TctC
MNGTPMRASFRPSVRPIGWRALSALAGIAGLFLTALVPGGAPAAQAATASVECRAAFRERRITLVVPYSAGGGYDQYARALAPVIQQVSGARVAVSNVPAGGGVVGARAVAESDAENLRLGLFEPSLTLGPSRRGDLSPEQFVALASMASEVQVWTARPDFSLTESRDRPLVVSVSDIGAHVIEVGLAAHALALPIRFTAGYKGSGDRFAAILRREVDFTANAATSALKATRGGDLRQVLVISDAPHPQMPDVPFLAGPGGLVDRQTARMPPPARKEALRIARQAVDLSRSQRAIYASARVPEGTLRCLSEIVEEVVFSESFARAAAAVGRPVEPADGRATRAAVQRMQEGADANRELLRRLLEAAAR